MLRLQEVKEGNNRGANGTKIADPQDASVTPASGTVQETALTSPREPLKVIS